MRFFSYVRFFFLSLVMCPSFWALLRLFSPLEPRVFSRERNPKLRWSIQQREKRAATRRRAANGLRIFFLLHRWFCVFRLDFHLWSCVMHCTEGARLSEDFLAAPSNARSFNAIREEPPAADVRRIKGPFKRADQSAPQRKWVGVSVELPSGIQMEHLPLMRRFSAFLKNNVTIDEENDGPNKKIQTLQW